MTSARTQQPRYRELAQSLRHDIASGHHPVGSLLPTETELCRSHGVSRYTVREALRSLRELGLVTRRQGSGTQVIAAEAAPMRTLQNLGTLDDVLHYARATTLVLGPGEDTISRGKRAGLLGCASGKRWRLFSGLRRDRARGAALCTTDVYIHPAFAAIESRLGEQPGAISELIEDMFDARVVEIHQEIAAVTLSAAQAEALNAAAGAAGLRIVRRYIGSSERLLEVSVSTHPADRYSYAMRIRREAGNCTGHHDNNGKEKLIANETSPCK